MSEDQKDFALFLSEIGATQHQLDEAAKHVGVVGIPVGFSHYVFVAASPIDGMGVFSKKRFDPGEFIAPGRINEDWTIVGRFTNHSKTPNSRVLKEGDLLNHYASVPIGELEEITLDYRQVRNELEGAALMAECAQSHG
jgi:SET domain